MDSCSSAERKDDKILHQGVLIHDLPARRLQQPLKAAEPTFDESLTIQMDGADFASLCWAFTHITACCRSSYLSCKTYREATKLCRGAAMRL